MEEKIAGFYQAARHNDKLDFKVVKEAAEEENRML